MKAQIGKWKNSLALRIPHHVVEELSLQLNDEVDCKVEDSKLVIEVIRPKEYTLDELLTQDIEDEPEIFWGKPEGKEMW
jgi:antitoxin MazE